MMYGIQYEHSNTNPVSPIGTVQVRYTGYILYPGMDGLTWRLTVRDDDDDTVHIYISTPTYVMMMDISLNGRSGHIVSTKAASRQVSTRISRTKSTYSALKVSPYSLRPVETNGVLQWAFPRIWMGIPKPRRWLLCDPNRYICMDSHTFEWE